MSESRFSWGFKILVRIMGVWLIPFWLFACTSYESHARSLPEIQPDDEERELVREDWQAAAEIHNHDFGRLRMQIQEVTETVNKRVQEEIANQEAYFSNRPEEYILGYGDVLEVIYSINYATQKKSYYLQVNDELEIEFLYNSDFNRKVTVRTDGKVAMPLIGDILLEGQTIEEAKASLIERYSEFLRSPDITITITFSNYQVEQLKRAVTTAPHGQSKIVPIRPDGKISLPMIGDVLSAGSTVEEVTERTNQTYAKIVPSIEVSILLHEVVSPEIYLLGSVNMPGRYKVHGHITLMQAIATGGGIKRPDYLENWDGDVNRILVVKRAQVREPRTLLIDLEDITQRQDLRKDIELGRGDVIFVPEKTRSSIFVLGEVYEPGAYSMASELYILHGLAMAKGFTPEAALDSVVLIRKNEDGRPVAKRVNCASLLTDDGSIPDIQLQDRDILYVPPTFITEVDRFIDQWFTKGLYSLFPENSALDFYVDLQRARTMELKGGF